MTDLVARIEAATGPDRDIDREIAPLVGIRVVDEGHPIGVCYYDQNGAFVPLPRFTASIDTALTLVPEGWTGIIPVRGGRGEDAWLWPENGTMNKGYRVTAATPALALCSAALKAREAGNG